MNESQLIKTIKAHIAAGDKAAEKSKQHYTAAGQYLKTLKPGRSRLVRKQMDGFVLETMERGPRTELEALIKKKIGINEWDIPINVLAYVAEQLGGPRGKGSADWKRLFDQRAISRLDATRFEYRFGVDGSADPCVVARIIEYKDGDIRTVGRARILRFKFIKGRFQLPRSHPRRAIEKRKKTELIEKSK